MSNSKKNNDWKERLNVVYSTNPDFNYDFSNQEEEIETLTSNKQNLKIKLDSKNRAGKKVTLVNGFIGKEEDLTALLKLLKNKCAVGGTVKDREIIIQGDFREKIKIYLDKLGYKSKII